ncbi:MAG: HD domain-containing protein [Clostridia bacterium]|nr:HD domain-containing protein [Clostridia bacterium]
MKISPAAERVIGVLRGAGYEAFCVGGCVRDMIMGREPNDFDITTSARPEQTKACFHGFHVIETGLKHGTVTVVIDGEPMEITTYRVDGEYLDNRRPSEVFFTSRLEDDLSRRDFTVNAMAYSRESGVVDVFGGREDIERKIIRAVGEPDRRFCEDGLRILRALRFASVLDFSIDRETAESIHRNRALLRNISAERILVEFVKLVCGKGAARVMGEFVDVVCEIIPEFEPSVGFDQRNPYHIYDVYMHSLRALEAAQGDKYVKLAVLFHDIGKPGSFSEDERGGHFYGHHALSAELTERALRRLKSDGKTLHTVVKLVNAHDRGLPPTEKSVRRLICSFGEEDTRRLIQVRRADNSALVEWLVEPRLAELDEIERIVDKIHAEGELPSLKNLAVHGDDIIKLGVSPGKRIGEILNKLLDDVLDGRALNDKQTLLDRAKQYIEK